MRSALLRHLGPGDRLEGLGRRRVHLAGGLGGQRVGDDLRHDGRAEAHAGGASVDHEVALLQGRHRSLQGGHRLAEHAREHVDVDGVAEDGRRLEGGSIGGRQAGHARGDQASQRLGEREVLSHELHRDDAAIGDGDGADVDEALDDLLDEERMAAGSRADEAQELVGGRLDVQAKRDQPLHFSRRQVAQVDRDMVVGLLERVREAGARGEDDDQARVLQPPPHLFEEREAVVVHRVGHVPRERMGAILAEALDHPHEGLPEARVRVPARRRRARAQRREHRVDLVGLEAQRAEPRLQGQDARVAVTLARAAEHLQHRRRCRRARTRCRAAGRLPCESRRCSRPCAGAARPRGAGASCRRRGRRGS